MPGFIPGVTTASRPPAPPARAFSLAAALALAAASALVATSAFAQGPADRSARWLLPFDGRSTNDVVHDPRMGAVIARLVPAAMARELLGALGGPPDPLLVTDGRHVSMSACMPHACDVKGFLWLDVADGMGLGAIRVGRTLRLGSRGFTPATIPAPARVALRAWLDDLGASPTAVRFLGARGGAVRMPAADVAAGARFRPRWEGPSFDCAAADGRVPRAICADTALAALDARTWRRAEEVRRAHSTRDAREELVAFQAAWRQRRDARCAADQDLAACLREEFARQDTALGDWLPSAARPR